MVTRGALLDLREMFKGEIIWSQDNHANFLNKWLQNKSNWIKNGNYEMCLELELFRVKDGRHPIVKLMGLDEIDNLTFVPEQDTYYIGQIAIRHGHNSFRNLTFKASAEIYNFYSQAHTHRPAVWRNAVCCGTNSTLTPSYGCGANPLLGGNSLIHADGSQQLLCLVWGEYS